MQTSPYYISIYPDLSKLGNSRHISGSFQINEINFGQALYIFDETPKYEINLTNTGDAILLQGTITSQAKTKCVRCLKEILININATVDGYFLLDKSVNTQDLKEDEYAFVDENNTFNIEDSLYAAINYDLPFTPLCASDCKGICQHCGQNLNEVTCDCEEKIAKKKANEINPNSPFAILKDYKFD